MTERRCDHNCQTHDYATALHDARTLRIDRVCDACCETVATFWANAEEGQRERKRSILDFAGILGPLPDGFDVVEWQRAMRDE